MGLFHKRLQTEISNIPVVGGATWDAELSPTGDIVIGTSWTAITGLSVASLPYGIYDYELYVLGVGGVAGASQFRIGFDGASGDAYPQFTGIVMGTGQGDTGALIQNAGGANANPMFGSDVSIGATESLMIVSKGTFTHHEFATYYGSDFVLSARCVSAGQVTIKASSYFKYKLIQAEDALM